MEVLLAMFLPLVLLWVGLALITGRSLAPEAVMRSMISFLWRIVRWLWRDRRQKGGGGRVKRPPIRYRR